MKKRGRFLKTVGIGLCAGVMVLGMVACGSGDSEDGSGKVKDIDMTEVGIAYENDYEGPEYELTREVYGLVKSEVGGYKYRYYDHEYDDKQQLIKVTRNSSKEAMTITYFYTYNDQGQLTAIKEDYSEEGGGYLDIAITYNENGYKDTQVFTSDVSEKNGDTYTYTYEYDDQGRATLMTCTSSLTDYTKTETYTYDEKGRVSRIDIAEPENSYIVSGFYYDENGNCITDVYYNSETGEAFCWNSYEYDEVTTYQVPRTQHQQLTTTEQWLYFEEAPFLPTPDSVVTSITFDSARESDGNMIYRFLLSEDSAAARAERYLYAEVIEEVCKCDTYDEFIFLQIADSEHLAITETQAVVYCSRLEDEGEDGRVYIDVCFPTEELDEYDILGIERPSRDSDDDSDSGVSYDSDEEGYWGADGYYNPSEKEKEENRREVEKWMKENW